MSESRALRLQAIRQILCEHQIGNQEELQRRVVELGYSCTQSSISRDLTDLGVQKTNGYYAFRTKQRPLELISAVPAGPNLLVLRTDIGAASRVAYEIDNLGLSEVVGTLAGDDTIFIAVASGEAQARVLTAIGASA